MIRIQLDLLEDQVQELGELMNETKIVTPKTPNQQRSHPLPMGRESQMSRPNRRFLDEATGTARELVMPALENVSPQPSPKQPRINLTQFLLNSPLPGSGLEVKRQNYTPQPIEL
jgi:hypothetical protein